MPVARLFRFHWTGVSWRNIVSRERAPGFCCFPSLAPSTPGRSCSPSRAPPCRSRKTQRRPRAPRAGRRTADL